MRVFAVIDLVALEDGHASRADELESVRTDFSAHYFVDLLAPIRGRSDHVVKLLGIRSPRVHLDHTDLSRLCENCQLEGRKGR